MNNLLKALIVWLMLVAIPFQGLAAASMLAGAPQKAAANMAPEHCAQMQDMQAMPDHATGADAHHASPHHHTSGKCSTCASCCCGAVMAPPAAVLTVPGETCALTAFHFAAGPVARVDLALPERPPKTSSI